MNLDQIREKLSDRNLSEVARRVGVTRAYISAIKTGVVTKLSEHTHKKLTEYFETN